MTRKLLGVAAIVFALSGCMGGGSAGTDVEVDDSYFEPETATAEVGDEFHFENSGALDHTVTIHKPPASGTTYELNETLGPGDDVHFTFETAGTYHVFCRFHGGIGSGMHMNVTVA